MKVAFLLILGLLSHLISSSCTVYRCGSPGAGNCMEYLESNNTLVFAVCPSSTPFCDDTGLKKGTTAPCLASSPTVVRLAAGLPCSSSSGCIAGTCSGGYCTGLSLGEACASSDQCGVTSYCSTSVCTRVPTEGQSCTDTCALGYFCWANMCKIHFSLPDWQIIPEYDCHAHMAAACASFSCYTWASNSTTMCIPAISSVGLPPVPCTDFSQCTSNALQITGEEIYGICSCGISPRGDKHCTMFPGDEYTVNAIQILQKAIEEGVLSNCNVGADYNACILAHWDTSNAVTFQYYWFLKELGPYIVGGEDCVYEVLFPEIYAGKVDVQVEGMGGNTIFIAAIALVALA